MAGEIPKVVGTLSRTAPGAVAGAPSRHVLHNEAHCAPGSISGPPSSQVLDNLTRNASACDEGVSPTRHGEMPSSRPRDFWGDGRIEGRVSIEGSPASRKVRLFDVLTGLLIAETWSRKDGQYRFDFLDPSREYFVLAHDTMRQFNAVVADWVKPEPTAYP